MLLHTGPCHSVQIHQILAAPVGLLVGWLVVVGVGMSQVTNTK